VFPDLTLEKPVLKSDLLVLDEEGVPSDLVAARMRVVALIFEKWLLVEPSEAWNQGGGGPSFAQEGVLPKCK